MLPTSYYLLLTPYSLLLTTYYLSVWRTSSTTKARHPMLPTTYYLLLTDNYFLLKRVAYIEHDEGAPADAPLAHELHVLAWSGL